MSTRRLSAPVENVLSRLSRVKPGPSGATALCPAHDDHRESLSVGEGDDGRCLLMCHAGCAVADVLVALKLEEADLFPARQHPVRVLAEYEYRDAEGKLSFVVERRVPKDFRQRRPDGNGGWIWSTKGLSPIPYNLPALLAAAPDILVVIVEGERDVETLKGHGILATTNSGGAGKWRPELSRHFAGRRVVILPDNDDAGRKHAELVSRELQPVAASVAIVELPSLAEKGDVSDWLNAGGSPGELRRMLAEARPVETTSKSAPRFEGDQPRAAEILEPATLNRQIEELYAKGLAPGYSTGFPSLDEHFTIAKGQMTGITGVPGHGKSNLLDAIAVNVARREELHAAIFSPENFPAARHAARILEKIVGRSFSNGPTPRMTPEDVRRGSAVLDHCFRFLEPAEERRTVAHILEILARLHDRWHLDIAIIDPWNEIDHTRPDGMTETEHVSISLSKIRHFAREREMHFFIVAHPAKLSRREDGSYPVPSLYDIAGSAHWRNKLDNGLVIWRDVSEGDIAEVEVHVAKIRFREVGRIGMVTLRYDNVTGRYIDPKASRVAAPREAVA